MMRDILNRRGRFHIQVLQACKTLFDELPAWNAETIYIKPFGA